MSALKELNIFFRKLNLDESKSLENLHWRELLELKNILSDAIEEVKNFSLRRDLEELITQVKKDFQEPETKVSGLCSSCQQLTHNRKS